MTSLTLTVTYDGSDTDIKRAISRMISSLSSEPVDSLREDSFAARRPSESTERIASQFAGFISRRPRLLNVMKAWLQRDGSILLSELVKVSGVKKQHDYGGVGGALTKNMRKAGGPSDWYSWEEQPDSDWVYSIADEYVKPLKRAFGL